MRERTEGRTRTALSFPMMGEGLFAALILAGAAFLRLWNLSANGWGNVYYAAAAHSGMESFHNAFFAAYDPAGFLSIDKPPLALWMQILSAKLFGYSGWSLHFPQVIAGALSVFALWRILRRDFGSAAGLAAALTLTVTPISVAVDRSNLPDSWLVLALILAAGAFLRAAETGRLLPLLGGAALAGVAFNVKMLAALVPVPAFFLAAAPGSSALPRVTAARLLAAVGVLVFVSASWAVLVDATPPAQRPYIGGSQENAVRDLIFGYNGAARLTGGAGQFGTGAGGVAPENAPPGLIAGGNPSLFRLFRPASAEQIMWLLPLSLFGLIVGACRASWRLPLAAKARSLILWGGWAGLYFGVLSASRGTYHPYYLSALSPALAALVGVGVAEARAAFADGGNRRIVAGAVIAVLLTALWQVVLLQQRGDGFGFLVAGLIVGATAVAGAGILAAVSSAIPLFVEAAVAVGASVLFIAPLLWCLGAGEKRNSGLFPAARPPSRFDNSAANAAPLWREPDEMTDPQTVGYLLAHQGNARFLCATPTVRFASAFIIATGKPVLALGGFLGSDPILTPETFGEKFRTGELRFFLDTGEYDIPGAARNDQLQDAVRDVCREVPLAAWRGPEANSPLAGCRLFDCRDAAIPSGTAQRVPNRR